MPLKLNDKTFDAIWKVSITTIDRCYRTGYFWQFFLLGEF